MSAERPIFVWGMTGAGKSTVGPLLAARLGLDVVDLDRLVAARAGRSIPAIWADEGEVGFRHREGAALAAVCADRSPRVVVLGGGALLRTEQRRAARNAGPVIALTARPETLAARLADATDRPLLAGAADLDARRARLAALLAERAAAYADVDLIVPTDDRSPEAVAAAIAARLGGEVAA